MQKVEIKLYGAKAQRSRALDNLLRSACRAAVRHFGHSFSARCDITVTDDEGIRQINREHRDVDKPTDVLSFPNLEFPAGREGDLGQAADWDRNPETGRIMLGDIIISLERAYEQAQAYGHGPLREVAFLCAHGLLHLLGYDHVEGEEPMFSIQNAVLNRANITREV